jgi:hypothetical protein
MGRAALLSARTGQEMLAWSQDQAAISNRWAQEDRERYQTVFQPMEDRLIADAQNYDTPERRSMRATEAQADVATATRGLQMQAQRARSARGVRPDSGAAREATRRSTTDLALASAGAGNTARRTVEAEGETRRAAAVDMGRGLAVNPGTSLGMATGAGNAGFQGAMNGYGQQANILGQDHSRRMQAWQADQASSSSLLGGLGSIAGLGLQMGWFSSEKVKENKRPARGALKAIQEMRVDEWDYKKGAGDGGHHVGPYAEEFQKATGLGDGKSIMAQDASGVTMGAVKELGAMVEDLTSNVAALEKKVKGRGLSKRMAA